MLTIARADTTYHLPGAAIRRDRLARRLDRVASGRLASVLSEALAGLGASSQAVYRIRRLDIDLWLDAGRLEDPAAAATWGRLIARTLAHMIVHGGPDVIRAWPDRIAYLASFLGDLAVGPATGRWEYEEFAPLEGVRTGRAAALILGAEPERVSGVFRALAGAGKLDPLIRRFDADDVRVLWVEGLSLPTDPIGPGPAEDVFVLPALRYLVLETGGTDARARNALRTLAAVTRQTGGPITAKAAHLSLQVSWLTALQHAVPFEALWRALADGEIGTADALAPVLSTVTGDLQPAVALLRSMLADTEGRQRLARILSALTGAPDPADGKGARTTAKPRTVVKLDRCTSEFAGLALLLPSARAMRLDERIGTAGLLQLFEGFAGPARAALARGDPGPAWFAGVAAADRARARQVSVDWPTAAEFGLADTPERLARDAEYFGDVPSAAVARRLLDAFARNLRGMDGTSAAYLARQFVVLPGEIIRTDTRIEARLDRCPLAVLLRMAARFGEAGPLPWLGDRSLIVRMAHDEHR